LVDIRRYNWFFDKSYLGFVRRVSKALRLGQVKPPAGVLTMANTTTFALESIQDALSGVRVRSVEPIVPVEALLPYAQNIVNFPYGTVFVACGETATDYIDDISIGEDFQCRVVDGKIVRIDQFEWDYTDSDGKWEYVPFEVCGWDISHEGNEVRPLWGTLPDMVAEGLYAIGILVR